MVKDLNGLQAEDESLTGPTYRGSSIDRAYRQMAGIDRAYRQGSFIDGAYRRRVIHGRVTSSSKQQKK